jgi:hypothetical protein
VWSLVAIRRTVAGYQRAPPWVPLAGLTVELLVVYDGSYI